MPELTISKSVLLTDLGLAINRYRTFTPGIYVCIHVPVVLDDQTRFVPGLVAQVNHGRLKQCEPEEHQFNGPPNFVFDVFDSSETNEYQTRRDAFAKFGVDEYVAVFADQAANCHWLRRNGETFEKMTPDENAVMKSRALPGLWFSTTHSNDQEGWALVGLIERGVTRLGHHEFMETILHKEGRDPEWGDWMPFESG